MAASTDLIDFDIIEEQKENIQALPSGRSAKSLAQLYSPIPGTLTSPAQTQDAHAATKASFESEIAQIDDSDDPLDIYDRYVRWTLEAYPSSSATPQSGLLPLLERATKAFLKTDTYRNDPRYLRLWLHHIRLFADAPRETFAFLARHRIGDGLAIYYEEFAAWLEVAGRWSQAEEIYRLGVERGARPVERLARKLREFEKRAAARPEGVPEPSSPALPVIRPALAAKLDPFAATSPSAAAADPQAASRGAQQQQQPASRKQKLQIFSDDGEESRPSSGDGPKGWDNIGTVAERRKENVRAPQPWTGETLNAGSQQNAGVPKMAIFKDKSLQIHSFSSSSMPKRFPPDHPALGRKIVNGRTGKIECVFVNLDAVYPNPQDPFEEYCFEELRAAKRGWLRRDWKLDSSSSSSSSISKATPHGTPKRATSSGDTTTTLVPVSIGNDDDGEGRGAHVHGRRQQRTVNLNDENDPSSSAGAKAEVDAARRLRREERANKTRKIKVREVKSETQTIQTNLDSPRGPKLKRKKSAAAAEPTMTLQTRAAMDEVYEMFNQTLTLPEEPEEEEEEESESESEEEEDDDESEDDYTSAGESTGTGRMSAGTSEYGEETQRDLTQTAEDETETEQDVEGETTWSEFTTSKHMPKGEEGDNDDDDKTGTSFAAGSDRGEEATDDRFEPSTDEQCLPEGDQDREEEQEVVTPTSPAPQSSKPGTFFIPIPPEGYVAPTRPYRDAAEVAANRLPFMTPIVEKTESSLGTATGKKSNDYFGSKTPCPKADQKTPIYSDTTTELWSSPFQDHLKERQEQQEPRIPQPDLAKANSEPIAEQLPNRQVGRQQTARKGPIIADAQCNPMDPSVHNTILSEIQPPLSSFEGYFEHKDDFYNRKTEIKKFCKAAAAAKNGKSLGERSLSALGQQPPVLRFEGAERDYMIKRELGAGAYAPVYLVENSNDVDAEEREDDESRAVMGKGKFGVARHRLEAIKMEHPPSAWEYYILRITHRRLGVHRAAESIVQAYEMHLFKDEGYLIEEYHEQGTLLDLVNLTSEKNRASGGHNGLDEILAMFFTVELLRTVEAMHAKGIIHGDLKADNILVRLSTASCATADETTQYRRDGSCGWSNDGIKLIDFGRGIDMRAFGPNVQFIADWPTSATDCAEMRELRPWTFQADYHGIAAIAHTMLFGKYIETVVEKNTGADIVAGGARSYRLREGLKRYWQTDIWNDFFSLMLNPGRHLAAEEGQRLPCTQGVRAVRETMETWLEGNAEKGVGLRAVLRRTEGLVGCKKRS